MKQCEKCGGEPRLHGLCYACYDDERKAEERTVIWILSWDKEISFGPGLTHDEACLECNKLMRSGYWRGSSDAYHRINLVPSKNPGPLYWAAYNNVPSKWERRWIRASKEYPIGGYSIGTQETT